MGAGGVSGTNLIVNGSFESGTTGWTGYGDSIEVGTAGAYGVSAVTGAMVAELDANCVGSNTGFYQNVATVAGQTYQLTVDLAQRAGYAASTNTVEVWWEGAKIATIDPASTALTKYSFTVTAVDASSVSSSANRRVTTTALAASSTTSASSAPPPAVPARPRRPCLSPARTT
jgi:hypothetical protein